MNCKIAVCLVAMVSMCTAHLCIVEPLQRGMNISFAQGSNDCIQLTGPCGGKDAPGAQPATTVWKAHGDYTVVFQKNLDHWTSTQATPGYFAVSLMSTPNATPVELNRIMDKGEASGTLFTATGTFPHGTHKGDQILQVTYVTNNPKAPSIFYSCADITLV